MAIRFAEGKVTQLRREFKILLDASHALPLESRLCQELCIERPDATAITSIYFDGPGYPLSERALYAPQNTMKVRIKEYTPDLGAAGCPRVVLEAKRERNGLTQKRRVWIPRESLGVVVHPQNDGMGILRMITRGNLVPVLGVTYRRLVFQRSEMWRVTFDTEVAFHHLQPDHLLGDIPLRRELVDPPFMREDRVVVEVKHLGAALPLWLAELASMQSQAYSKFATGMEQLVGPPPAELGVQGG